MSGVVTFFWLDEEGDAHYVRIPRDEVRAVRLKDLESDPETEIQLAGSYQDITIRLDPLDAGLDESQARTLGNKIIDSIRSLTDENVSWEHDGDRWKQRATKNSDVWGLSR